MWFLDKIEEKYNVHSCNPGSIPVHKMSMFTMQGISECSQLKIMPRGILLISQNRTIQSNCHPHYHHNYHYYSIVLHRIDNENSNN